ncbi:alpha/beta hydrolase [Kineosporia babensis]|uniref:Alpha/beta hydrolase n=1 Tax=Kineosporia babensis TaxID=499548 RepID=A0A9X1NDS9_9ACTN|nr:alpha/beta hydrolase [Kineosporia babensis]MCD5311896.1 alpha/beta hydrolase [Kineosporia babensis]
MSYRKRKTLSGAAVLAAIATTLLVAPAQASETPVRSSVKWGACPEEVAAKGLECATVKVPLDHRKREGQSIEIALSRLASTDPAKRRGVLLTNPGGPGYEGRTFPTLMQEVLPKSVLSSYDVIGFDPRGMGASAPVTCDMTQEQLRYGNIPPWANGPKDVKKRAAEVKTVAEQCLTSESRAMLPYISTANTARDMDLIRQALGEPKLSYLGYSYGSHLGAVYTSLFPERSDRIVLDSNTGPGGLDRDGSILFAQGLKDRFPDFAKWLAARDEKYGMGSTQKEVKATFFELARELDRKPLKWLTGSDFRIAAFAFTYSDSQFTDLAELWDAVKQGADADPGPVVPVAENQIAGHLHVICNDSYWPKTVKFYQRDVKANRARYPMLGAAAANIRPCAFWPEPIEAPVTITDRGPANVLMVQNLRDPGTPLAGALRMRKAFGERARIVTADQGGHGTYALGTNRCANDTTTKFLVTGRYPAQDVACKAEKK